MKETHSPTVHFEGFDFRELPIGIYVTSLDGRFLFANRTMREMLGLPAEGEIQTNIRDLYANPAYRDAAIEEAVRLAKEGRNVERGKLHLKVRGQEMYIEDYCKTLRDENGELIGFAGCMVDVTRDHASRQHEKELQERVEELRLDIGRILHANTTTLLMVKQTLDAVAEAFEPKPYRDLSVPHAEEVEAMLTEHAQALVNAIERIIQGTDEGRRLKALPASQWKTLQEYSAFLKEFKERIPTPESYSVTLRKVANEVGQIHAAIAPGHLSREQLRELQNAAWHLERLTNLIEVLETRAAVIQMDYTIHSLREFITTDKREKAAPVNISIKSLIEESAKRLAEYARSLKIDIERKEVEDAVVNVIEQDVQRALTNLLHNAIKYSWRRDPERAKPAWVSVRAYIKDRQVCVEFENWGVPVKREEIETGRIFELGYRGELSRDRGRLGTGIGLTDARRVAEAHGGHLEIESHPAVRGAFNEKSQKYYRQPFLTKVRIFLPLAGSK